MLGPRRCFAVVSILAFAIAVRADVQDLPSNHWEWPAEVFECAYRLVATPAEWEELHALSTQDLLRCLDRFWKKRDPSPSTARNEFEAQFRERVEYACRWFKTVSTGRPWDDRGDVYIRLGPPDERQQGVDAWYAPEDTVRLHPMGGVRDAYKGLREGTGGMVSFLTDWFKRDYGEIWTYYRRNLTLQFQGYHMDYELVPVVDANGNYQKQADFQEARYRADTATTAYAPPHGTEYRDVAMDCFPFRRPDGGYDLYIGCAFPTFSFATARGFDSVTIDIAATVTVFDSTLQMLWVDSAKIDQRLPRADRGKLVHMQWAAALPPGLYIMTVEVADQTGAQRAVCAMDRWLVPYADSVALDLSPLVLASEIEPATASSANFVRNGKRIKMTPGRIFASGQDVYFYHEVYNLARQEDGASMYSITYTLYDERAHRARLLTNRTLESSESWVFQTGRIAHRRLRKGTYILEVKTRDLVSDVSRVALANFKVD